MPLSTHGKRKFAGRSEQRHLYNLIASQPWEGVMSEQMNTVKTRIFLNNYNILAALCFAVMLVSCPASARECFWDGSSPICRGRCPAGYDTVAVKACLNGNKVKCCEKLGSTTSDGGDSPYVPASKKKATRCPSGLVWRERFDGDTVCVTPLERDENRRRRGL
jgi:hypothetical protein